MEATVRNCVVVELAGLPSTGKTQTARQLRRVLQDDGLRVAIVRESADIVPLRQLRGRWQFNVAMALQMFQRLLIEQAASGPLDVVVFDRGPYDAACWFDWLRLRDEIASCAHRALIAFLRDVPWTDGADLTYQCTASYATSLARRRGKQGFVVNEATFAALTEVYGLALQGAPSRWPSKRVTAIDTEATSLTAMADLIVADVRRALRDGASEIRQSR